MFANYGSGAKSTRFHHLRTATDPCLGLGSDTAVLSETVDWDHFWGLQTRPSLRCARVNLATQGGNRYGT